MSRLKQLYCKYRHSIPLLIYMVVYLVWFVLLEQTPAKGHHIIHLTVDDYIPFCEVFIIPYLLWFLYVAAVVVYLFFVDKSDYYKACMFLMTGMTIFLIISTLMPNGHDLRPATLPRDNCFTRIITYLWNTDTPTNLWPSIHVYNSMGAHFAVMHNSRIARSRYAKPLRLGSGILSLSIILSTMFIKQHSVFDVVTGILLGTTMYVIVYKKNLLLAEKPQKRKNKRTPQAE